jgi:hypothetical protein
MNRAHVKIPIARLVAGKAFAREIYLSMPRNGKLLRLARKQGELTPAMLARIVAEGTREVYGLPEVGDATDPERFPLYVMPGDAPLAAQEAAAADSDEAPSPESINAAMDEALSAFKPDTTEEESTRVKPLTAEEETAQKVAADFVTEESRKARGKFDADESEENISGGGEAEDATRVKGAREQDEDSRLRVGESSESFEARRVRGFEEGTEGDAHSRVDGEAGETFGAKSESGEGSLVTKVSGAPPIGQEQNSEGALDAIELAAARAAKNAGAHAQGEALRAAREEEGFSAQGKLLPTESVPEQVTIVRGGDFDSGERASRTSEGDAVRGPALAAIEEDLRNVVEQFRKRAAESGDPAMTTLAADLDGVGNAFRRFAAGETTNLQAIEVLADTLEEAIFTVGALPTTIAEALRSSAPAVRAALEMAASAVEQRLEEAEHRFSSDSKPADKDKGFAAEGVQVPGEYALTSRSAAAYKETPQIAGRLAALLGHSLGYASQDFLADLALTAVLVFSAKAGAKIDEAAVTPLGRAALVRTHVFSDGVVEDSLWIIDFLEAYFRNPECDRTQKEFSKRVFDNTLAALEGRNAGPHAAVAARWRQFVERGLTMNAASASSRAIARANKAAKDIIQDASA